MGQGLLSEDNVHIHTGSDPKSQQLSQLSQSPSLISLDFQLQILKFLTKITQLFELLADFRK